MALLNAYLSAILLIALGCSLFVVACYWQLFEKAGKPGWAALVPFYHTYVLFDLAWGSGILFLLLLIPGVDVVIAVIVTVKLAQAFGKDVGYGVLLFFFWPIVLPILAFGNSTYRGVPGRDFVA